MQTMVMQMAGPTALDLLAEAIQDRLDTPSVRVQAVGGVSSPIVVVAMAAERKKTSTDN